MSDGLVFDIYKGTTHDGPGMRDTVFLKGCPLHCKWCHNPESIEKTNQIWYDNSKCIGCFACVKSCPENALLARYEGISVDYLKCFVCGACTSACPSGALSEIAKKYTADDVLRSVITIKFGLAPMAALQSPAVNRYCNLISRKSF